MKTIIYALILLYCLLLVVYVRVNKHSLDENLTDNDACIGATFLVLGFLLFIAVLIVFS